MAIDVKKPQLCQLPIEQLHRGRYQPRRQFDETALSELADSIRSSGLIQPIVVRQTDENTFEIIAGERRWRAAQRAGLSEISCLINNYSDAQAAAVTAIENIQRKNLNPIEEARSLQRLVEDFSYHHDEVAAIIGKSRSQVTNILRLLRLDERVQQWLIQGILSEGHGKILAGIPNSDQYRLAEQCVNQEWSVRQLEQQIKKLQSSPESAPIKADIQRLERILAEQLGAKVKIETDPASRSGWLRIQFHNNDTLEGLLEKIGLSHDI
jgi:ParB family chromosome partitioning protein